MEQLRSRLRSIDCLRGGAALAVVVHHALELRSPPDGPWRRVLWFRAIWTVLHQGYLGVPLFFVISGFCIHLRCAQARARRQKPALAFGSFWKRRIHRLYPPYVAALCLSMSSIVVAVYLLKNPHAIADYPAPHARWIGFDFVAHLFLLHGLIPKLDLAAGNPSFWTLAREEYLYLLYFFVFAWRAKWGIYRALLLVLSIGISFDLAFLIWPPSRPEVRSTLASSAVVLWIQWCLGMLAVEAYYGVVRLPAYASKLYTAILAGMIAKLAELYLPLLAPALWGVTFFVLINWCVKRESEGRLSNSRAISWLAGVGVFSYSLYLVHFPLQRVAASLLRPSQTIPAYAAVCLLLVVASYYAGRIFFLIVEKRFLNAGADAINTAISNR